MKWQDILRLVKEGNPKPDRLAAKTDAEWQARLTPEQYRVTRQKGTEQAFSSAMCRLFEPGQYACICCGTLLFDAEQKFKSRSGWPSFTQPQTANAVAYYGDQSHGMQRVETVCNTCGAHLGHVFPDGPDPAGLRYCINAVALKKIDSTETIDLCFVERPSQSQRATFLHEVKIAVLGLTPQAGLGGSRRYLPGDPHRIPDSRSSPHGR